MSNAALYRSRHAAGLCVRCSMPHSEVNHKTGGLGWRCAPCRKHHTEVNKRALLKLGIDPEQEPRRRCECGGLILNPDFVACYRCLVGRPKKPARKPASRHVPTSIYVQHDLIAARYMWAHAVSR